MEFFHITHSISEKQFSMPTPHSHPYYELEFLISGTRHFFTNSKLYSISSGCLTLTAPYELHKFESSSHERYLVCISEEFISKNNAHFLKKFSTQSVVRFDEKTWKILLKLLDKMYSTYNSNDDDKLIKLSLQTGYLLYVLSANFRAQIPNVHTLSNSSPITLKVANYINQHYQAQISLDELCHKFNVSKSWLNRSFNKEMNCSVIDYHLKTKISKAQLLVRESDMSFNEIAKKLGFKSANHFTILFKKKVGVSPREYRKNWIVRK